VSECVFKMRMGCTYIYKYNIMRGSVFSHRADLYPYLSTQVIGVFSTQDIICRRSLGGEYLLQLPKTSTFFIEISKSPPTKMPWLGRLAYDECNKIKLERFQNEHISHIPMQHFMFSNAIKNIYPWEMESNNS
jgi:hypothetical protein